MKTGREFAFLIRKQSSGPYWPRLLSVDQGKPHWLRTDFDKWKDEGEDEDDVDLTNPFGPAVDFSKMASMSGLGGGQHAEEVRAPFLSLSTVTPCRCPTVTTTTTSRPRTKKMLARNPMERNIAVFE